MPSKDRQNNQLNSDFTGEKSEETLYTIFHQIQALCLQHSRVIALHPVYKGCIYLFLSLNDFLLFYYCIHDKKKYVCIIIVNIIFPKCIFFYLSGKIALFCSSFLDKGPHLPKNASFCTHSFHASFLKTANTSEIKHNKTHYNIILH